MSLAKHILLISGPSGSGKSTLIDQLVEGRLDPAIRGKLPEGCERWPHLEANAVLRYNKPAAAFLGEYPDSEGIILHYDIAFIHRYDIDGYDADPTMEFFDHADSVHSLFLKPDVESLRQQFLLRRELRNRSKSALRLWWGRTVRRRLKRLKARLKGWSGESTEDFYLAEGWLQKCYERWGEFIGRMAERTDCRANLVVEPCLDAQGRPAFRLLAPSGEHEAGH